MRQPTEKNQQFVGEFEEWHKTHFEIVRAICATKWVEVIQERYGYTGLCDYAKKLTDEFRIKNPNRKLDLDLMGEIEKFVDTQYILFYTANLSKTTP